MTSSSSKARISSVDNTSDTDITHAASADVASLDYVITSGLLVAHAISIFVLVLIYLAAREFDGIEETMAFYGVYHREPWNQVVHFFGVPGIIWSGLVFLAHFKVPFWSKYWSKSSRHPFTYNMVLTVFYLLFYLQIDLFGGILYAPVLYIMYATSKYWVNQDQLVSEAAADAAATNTAAASTSNDKEQQPQPKYHWYGTGRLLRIALMVHVLSWYVQIHLGHHILEGATPAVLQSFGGALTSAPLFAFYEGLWWLGINKELQVKTLQLVEQYTIDLCTSGAITMRACASATLAS
jgi:uncharacterized membrane protein YGL010W